jgi:hypothetical protein
MTGLDSREPPGGDFVSYVEKIEREQLARAMRPHNLPQLSAGGKVVADEVPGDSARALSVDEAQRLLQALKARGNDGASPSRGAMIGVVLGAALIAFGLLAEGGVVLVLLGAVLLWHNLRKLRRAPAAVTPSPAQQVDRTFGRKAPGATGKHGA